jgi:tRNA threonylcarbamoyladenosine biosynthesis protein TsaB
MTCLIIETSSSNSVIGIGKKDEVLSFQKILGDRHLSRILLPSIQALLQESHLTLNELDYIAVGVGPGSYTGTRVGATVGKTLSFALNIPLLGFPSSWILSGDLASAMPLICEKWKTGACAKNGNLQLLY